jgi:mono/diheme cytochrome c family protein
VPEANLACLDRQVGVRMLLFCALALAATGCLGRKDPPAGADGPLIYEFQNCRNCHGENGEGSSLGPPLAGLSSSWSRDELALFLNDPAPVLEANGRLRALANAYSGEMARYDNLTEEQRGVLAAWLLERHP